MRGGWSIPMGRILGVEIRLHFFFALLLGLAFVSGGLGRFSALRGVALWLLLLGFVGVREMARGLVSAYYGLRMRTILLLPIGGLPTYATPEDAEEAAKGRAHVALAVVGPVANVLTAAVLLGFIYGVAPQVAILAKPWISATHLLRSAFWLSLFLAAINLLPAYPLDAGRLLRGSFSRSRGNLGGTRAASGIGQAVALALFVAGIFLQSPWLLLAGFFIFVGAQLEDQGVVLQSVVDTVRMQDIMLTDFASLLASDTLEDALSKAIHSLQDDFPVVRSGLLVGITSRQRILEALQMDGNGYVQSVMARTFQVAQPQDSLGATFRRISAGAGLSMVPVLQGEQIVGIVTLQNLMHSMGLLAESRRLRQQSAE
jgi:Zn-dependent protease/CBS domain-containing protein